MSEALIVRLGERMNGYVKTNSKTARGLPIWLLMTWLLLTVYLFEFGPYEYPLANRTELYVYLFFVHLALILGYYLGLSRRGRPYIGPSTGKKIAKVCVILTPLLLGIGLLLSGGGDLGRIFLLFSDPAAAYSLSVTKGNVSIINYLQIAAMPLQVVALALGVYYWQSLSVIFRTVFIFTVALILLTYLGGATRAGIVFTLFIMGGAIMQAYYTGRLILSKRQKKGVILLGIAFLVIFFVYVDYLVKYRNPGQNQFINPLTLESPAENNFLYRILPDGWELTASVTTFYVSHGYARLARAMEMPFVGSGFGIANSPFLIRNFKRVTGLDMEKYSYGLRLDPYRQEGAIGTYWSTMYSWIASDTTFPGSVLFVFLLGFLFGLAWKDVLIFQNPIAVVAFCCLANLIFSLPRTNPLQDAQGITIFVGLIGYWVMSRNFWRLLGKHKTSRNISISN